MFNLMQGQAVLQLIVAVYPENVSNLVREYRADIGLALDGDVMLEL